MLEYAETDPALPGNHFHRVEDQLRTELLLRQYELLRHADRTILLLIAGIDGVGKGSTINQLNEWLDPRHIHTLAFDRPTPEERRRPPMWRYWNALPPKGHIGLIFGSWYSPLLLDAYQDRLSASRLAREAQTIRRFEDMLIAENVLVVKFWYHMSRHAQQARCQQMLADPDTAWRVSEADLRVVRHYDDIRHGAVRVLQATQNANAPWHVIPSADPHHRIVATARLLRDALVNPLPPKPSLPAPQPHPDQLSALDYRQTITKADYEAQLPHWQGRLSRAVRRPSFAKRSLVLVFEGDDAAGKGGTIRRIAHALDVRQYHIMPVSAPNDVERSHPYLWRFWRNVPPRGRIGIFDRSWYGRVLIERVEQLTSPSDWERAYTEIKDFEHEWVAHGAILLKFWLAITQREQLKRFHAREKSPFKSFKLTPDDWRNRELNPQYRAAASEMLERTHTESAPWHVIATDDKRLARVTVLRTIAEALEGRLGEG
ncbi:MAG: polyphosphate:AMP phosphotransferase [Pigmentiphaga sp.]|nr:polyphosphate:AMP phosphotransferase [Pigmentiphaga sp.]